MVSTVVGNKQYLMFTAVIHSSLESLQSLIIFCIISQTNDLTAVYLGVKFSCRFTLKDIQERWYALLFDPVVSRLVITKFLLILSEVYYICSECLF